MDFITWKDDMSVKVASIDAQHKKLIKMINDLHEAMRNRKAKEAVGDIINGLVEYTTVHFSYEEDLFKKHKFTGTLLHEKEHRNFVKKIEEFEEGFEKGKLFLSTDVLNFLKEWLVSHIQGTDKKYADFFVSKGVK